MVENPQHYGGKNHFLLDYRSALLCDCKSNFFLYYHRCILSKMTVIRHITHGVN